MDSFFFIPGSKLHKVNAIRQLGVDKIIIDLEDGIKGSGRDAITENLITHNAYLDCYIRLPLICSGKLILDNFINLLDNGYRKFVFPKINDRMAFEQILPSFKNTSIEIILLVETPMMVLEVEGILNTYRKYISGIGLGSHDLTGYLGALHNLENLEVYRQRIVLLARAYEIIAIDIATMELRDSLLLRSEIMDGFKKGYDAKFIIHPKQLQILKQIDFYSEREYQWAKKVDTEVKKAGGTDEFNPIVIDGQIIEKPHLNRVYKILKYYKYGS